MPVYEFVCKECKKSFARAMSFKELGKSSVACPHCKSKKTEQKPAAFYAVTSKKS